MDTETKLMLCTHCNDPLEESTAGPPISCFLLAFCPSPPFMKPEDFECGLYSGLGEEGKLLSISCC